jgi:hypothetical protein
MEFLFVQREGAPTKICLEPSEQALPDASADEHKQPKDTQQRNIEVQVDHEMLLDSGRYAGETWE